MRLDHVRDWLGSADVDVLCLQELKLSNDKYPFDALREIGVSLIGQTDRLVPADKKLYALRDVTATVESIPLITASIMSKKLAEGLNRLVLDVKWGSGAFMKTQEEAHRLAHSLVTVGEAMGVRSSVRLSEMNEPTGESAGNALEVAECVRCLKGEGPQDLEDIVLDLASAVSVSSRSDLAAMLHRGDAWRKFQKMVAAQGGNVDALEKMATVHRAPFIGELKATVSGTLTRMDAGGIGQAVLELGAGRSKAADPIDYAVGCDQIAKTGTHVQTGDVLLRVHARTKGALFRTLDILGECIHII